MLAGYRTFVQGGKNCLPFYGDYAALWEKYTNYCYRSVILDYTQPIKIHKNGTHQRHIMADENKSEDDVNASLEGENAENAEGAEGAESAGSSSKKKKIIIIAVAVLVLLVGAGAGLYFTGMLDKFLKKEAATEEGAAKEGEHGAEGEAKEVCTKDEQGKEVCAVPGAQFLKIPDMVVNLNSEDGAPRYLRLSVQLEFKNAEDMAAVEKLMPRVVDQFQTYLRELRVKDLRGSAGIYRLQMELLARVNQAAYPIEVQDVLFQEILIQ